MSIYDTQRDISEGGIQSVLDYWWSKRNIDLHTQIPAKVVEVNYTKNAVTVQPLIKTYINADQTMAFPQCIDVPMALLSSGRGAAKITIPVKVGAIGLLKFSERDIANWIQSVGNEIVLPEIKDNLSMGAKMYPVSFEVGLFTPASAIDWDSENIVIDNPTGNVLVNGCIITPEGNVITKNGTDLDQLKADFDAHVHGGVTSGGASTSTPTIP